MKRNETYPGDEKRNLRRILLCFNTLFDAWCDSASGLLDNRTFYDSWVIFSLCAMWQNFFSNIFIIFFLSPYIPHRCLRSRVSYTSWIINQRDWIFDKYISALFLYMLHVTCYRVVKDLYSYRRRHHHNRSRRRQRFLTRWRCMM